jgi:hypothetical protein
VSVPVSGSRAGDLGVAGFSRSIVPWIVTIAVQFLATVRTAEEWSFGNVLGALALLVLAAALVVLALRVTGRR